MHVAFCGGTTTRFFCPGWSNQNNIYPLILRVCDKIKKKKYLNEVYCVSSDCCVTHPRSAMVCLQFVIVVVPDHTHLMFMLKPLYNQILAVSQNVSVAKCLYLKLGYRYIFIHNPYLYPNFI